MTRNLKSGNLRRVRALGRAGAFAALGLCAVTSLAPAADRQLAGIWRIEKPVFAVRTVDGKAPPLKPEAAKLYAEHQAARKAGDTSFDSATWCASVGVPRITFIDYPFELVVRDPYVAFLHEWDRWARIVYLDGALSDGEAASRDFAGPPLGAGPGAPPEGFPQGPPPGFGPPPGGAPDRGGRALGDDKNIAGPMGLSKGRWEGNTLVIDTDHFSPVTLLDSAGLPHSDALKINEHLRLRSPDVLENRIRIEDPKVFTEAWETLVTYKRQSDAVIREDACLDRIRTGDPAVKE